MKPQPSGSGLGHTNRILYAKGTSFDFDHAFNTLFGRTIEDIERKIGKNSCCLGFAYKNKLGREYGRVKQTLLKNQILIQNDLAQKCEQLKEATSEDKNQYIKTVLRNLSIDYLKDIQDKKNQKSEPDELYYLMV